MGSFWSQPADIVVKKDSNSSVLAERIKAIKSKKLQHSKKINIVKVGQHHAGKSSTQNSENLILTQVFGTSPQKIEKVFTSGGRIDKHVTTFPDYYDIPNTNIRLIDIPALLDPVNGKISDSNVKFLKQVFEGIDFNFDRKDYDFKDKDGNISMEKIYEKGFGYDPDNVIHGVVYVIQSSSFTSDGSLMNYEMVQHFMNIASYYGLRPIVLITNSKKSPITSEVFEKNKQNFFTTDEYFFIENYTYNSGHPYVTRDLNIDSTICDYYESLLKKAEEIDFKQFQGLKDKLSRDFIKRDKVKSTILRLKAIDSTKCKNKDLLSQLIYKMETFIGNCDQIEDQVKTSFENLHDPYYYLKFFEKFEKELINQVNSLEN